MSNIDPDAQRVVETARVDPVTGATEVTRSTMRTDSAAWWMIAVIAIGAIIGIGYMVTRQPSAATDNQALAAAANQAHAQGVADAQAADAQTNAQVAGQAAQSQADQAASRAQTAADSASASAAQARSAKEQPANADQDSPPQ